MTEPPSTLERSYEHADGTWRLRAVESLVPDEKPSTVWLFELPGLTRAPWELSDVYEREVIQKVGGLQDCFAIDVTTRRTEWGASGANWAIVIEALALYFGQDVYDYLKLRLLDLIPVDRQREPIKRKDALRHAKGSIVAEYPEDADALSVQSEERAEEGWTFVLTNKAATFTVTVTQHRKGLRATRIKRERR